MNAASFAALTGALYGLLGVACGAFGAHALKARLSPELLAVWKTAVDYQMWHALALVLVGLLAESRPAAGLGHAALAMALGVLLFSGSLYALALSGLRGLGAVTPLGGVLLLAGWTLLLLSALKRP